MKTVLVCGDIRPGCDKVIEGKTEDEVFAKAEAHVNQIEAAIKGKT